MSRRDFVEVARSQAHADPWIPGWHVSDQVSRPGVAGDVAEYRASDRRVGGVGDMASSREGFQSVHQGFYASEGLEVGVEIQASQLVDQLVSPDIRSLGEVAAVPEQPGEGAVQGLMPPGQGCRPSGSLRPDLHFPVGVERFPLPSPLDHEGVHRLSAQPDVVDHLGYEDAHFGGRLVRTWRL